MNKSTKITGVDCKIGRKSRTGSTVTMSIPEELVLDCVNYFKDIDSNKDPSGKIKRIELVMYTEEDMEEVETIESLRAEIKELKEFVETVDKVVENAEMLDEAIAKPVGSCESCDRKPTLGNCMLQCSLITENPKDINLYEGKEILPPNQPDLKPDPKKCECNSTAFIDGKCCNCGGVE